MSFYTLDPFMKLPDCGNLIVYNQQDYRHIPCDDIHRKIISIRIYFTLIIVNLIFITSTTAYYIYRTVSAKWDPQPNELTSLNVSKQWQAYSLKKRGLFGTILGAIGHLVFSTTVLLYQAFVTDFTCEIYMWGPLVGFYIWTYALIWRTLRLHLLIRVNELQQRFLDRCPMADSEHDKDYQWFMRHKDRLNASTQYHLAIFLITMLVIALIIILSEVFSIRVNGESRCQFYWGNYIVMGMVVFFFVVVVPFAVWYLRGDSDAHGIRQEIWAALGVGVPCFVICIIWQILFEYPTNAKPAGTRGVFGPSNWIIIVTTTSHVMSVILPVFGTISLKHRKRSSCSHRSDHGCGDHAPNCPHSDPEEFRQCIGESSTAMHSCSYTEPLELTTDSLAKALRDPNMLQLLRTWAIKDFSVENVLFYDRYLQLTQNIESSLSEKQSDQESISSGKPSLSDKILNTPLGSDQLPSLIDFYDTFIAENAPLEVNISHKARSSIDAILGPLSKKFTKSKAKTQRTFSFDVSPENLYLNLPMELVSVSHDKSKEAYEKSMHYAVPTVSTASTSTVTTTQLRLQIFEPARKEVFWNIFSGLFPKIVAAYNNEEK